MLRQLPVAVITLALLGLGLRVLEQDRRIAELAEDLEELRASAQARIPAAPILAAQQRQAAALTAVSPAQPAAAAPHVPAEPAEPRAAVTRDEIARVESAVLSLLEADRPELREKLRAVVQEHQDTVEQERQEQRRERWVARMEARLSELGGEVALSSAQREAIVGLLLANRDQIWDGMRNAATSEEFAAARATAQRLREEADTQIRGLLRPEQYEAYRQLMQDDDSGGRPFGRRRGTQPPDRSDR